MPTNVFGIPLHPLAVHLPIIAVPVLTLAVFGYLLIPRFRQRLGWVLMTLTVLAPPAVFAARWSGQRLAAERIAELAGSVEAAAQTAQSINHHSQYGDVLIWLVTALAPVVWLFAGLASGTIARFTRARSWPDLSGRSRRAALAALGTAAAALALTAAWYVVRAGHTGAEMIWGG